MPTLHWIGKEKIVNHHRDVPFKVLEEKYTYTAKEKASQKGETTSENKIIHGDNLEALKSLLPEYAGKVNCIYIDPPYNTGNENWVYNDNVNDPRIGKWLSQVVGKEGEDLSRHDKWLCMMYPRLMLLHQLLSHDGIIAVSIDDNELFYLGQLLNEIFGMNNLVACSPWKSEPSGGKNKRGLRIGHEYIIIYTKGDTNKLSQEEVSNGELNLKDKFGYYRKGRELNKWGEASLRVDRPDMWFPLYAPDGSEVYPIRNDGKEGRWRWGKKNPVIQNILTDPEYAHWEIRSFDSEILYNGKSERWFPFEKIRNKSRSRGWNTWLDKFGTNAMGTEEIKAIFGQKIFNTPKPSIMIEWLVSLFDDDNAIILDSFAGSGTTAHAVLNLNKEDGGSRKFILIEMEDYAESITAERVKRVIDGYGEGNSKKEGTGGDFSYYTLGKPLFANGSLNPELPALSIQEYVYFMETGLSLNQSKENPYFMGKNDSTAYYFLYDPKKQNSLDYSFLKSIQTEAERYVIYAESCLISESFLEERNIYFKKIPADIPRV